MGAHGACSQLLLCDAQLHSVIAGFDVGKIAFGIGQRIGKCAGGGDTDLGAIRKCTGLELGLGGAKTQDQTTVAVGDHGVAGKLDVGGQTNVHAAVNVAAADIEGDAAIVNKHICTVSACLTCGHFAGSDVVGVGTAVADVTAAGVTDTTGDFATGEVYSRAAVDAQVAAQTAGRGGMTLCDRCHSAFCGVAGDGNGGGIFCIDVTAVDGLTVGDGTAGHIQSATVQIDITTVCGIAAGDGTAVDIQSALNVGCAAGGVAGGDGTAVQGAAMQVECAALKNIQNAAAGRGTGHGSSGCLCGTAVHIDPGTACHIQVAIAVPGADHRAGANGVHDGKRAAADKEAAVVGGFDGMAPQVKNYGFIAGIDAVSATHTFKILGKVEVPTGCLGMGAAGLGCPLRPVCDKCITVGTVDTFLCCGNCKNRCAQQQDNYG